MQKHLKHHLILTAFLFTLIFILIPHAHAANEGEVSEEIEANITKQQKPSSDQIHKWSQEAKEKIFAKREQEIYDTILSELADLITPAAKHQTSAKGGQERTTQGIELLNNLSVIHTAYPLGSAEKQEQLEQLIQSSKHASSHYNDMNTRPLDPQKPFDGDISRLTVHTQEYIQSLVNKEYEVKLNVVRGVAFTGGVGAGIGTASDPCGNKYRTFAAQGIQGVVFGGDVKAGVYNTRRSVVTEKDGKEHYRHNTDSQGQLDITPGVGITMDLIPGADAKPDHENSTFQVGIGLAMGFTGTRTKSADLYSLPVCLYGRDYDYFRSCAGLTPELANLPRNIQEQLENASSEGEARTIISHL